MCIFFKPTLHGKKNSSAVTLIMINRNDTQLAQGIIVWLIGAMRSPGGPTQACVLYNVEVDLHFRGFSAFGLGLRERSLNIKMRLTGHVYKVHSCMCMINLDKINSISLNP